MNKNLERFLKYVKIDTQSDELSNTIPSTLKQLDLAKVLYQELLDLNVKCSMSNDGIIMGEIPSNIDKDVPTIGFRFLLWILLFYLFNVVRRGLVNKIIKPV